MSVEDKREVTIYGNKEIYERWAELIDELYPETVAKYKKLKIIVK